MSKVLKLSLAIGLLGVLGSCMKIHEDFLVMPDGSGRLTFVIAVNLETDEEGGMEPSQDADPAEEFLSEDPDAILKQFPGIVAITKPKSEKKDKWQVVTFTMYFEDINKLEFRDEATQKAKQTFSFKKEGAGYVLEMKDGLIAEEEKEEDDSGMNDEMKKQIEEMFQKMIKGFEVKVTVKMPGTVTSAENFSEKSGRTATWKLDESMIKKSEDMKKHQKMVVRKIVCGASEVSDSDQADFKKEIEKAKVEWEALKKEMKKNFEKKKGDDK